MAKIRTCVVCHGKYEYCGRCKEYATLPTWYNAFCGVDCHEIELILNRYYHKHITAEDAKEMLKQYDFSKVKASDSVELIEEIMSTTAYVDEVVEDKPKRRYSKKASAEVEE